jgi:capsular polysaccharide biosynthesis protein
LELREYWNIIRRRWWLPAAVTLVALIASAGIGLNGAAAHKTDMRVSISILPRPTDAGAVLYYDPNYYANLDSEYLADDMTEFMASRAFASEVSRELATASPRSVVDVATVMSATRTRKTHRFIDVTITSSTPEQGQQIAESINRILSDPPRLANYLKVLNSSNAQMSVVTPPVTHRAQTPLGLASEIALRTVIGLLVGLAVAFLVDYLDQSVRSREEAELVLRTRVLGQIPRPRSRRGVAA